MQTQPQPKPHSRCRLSRIALLPATGLNEQGEVSPNLQLYFNKIQLKRVFIRNELHSPL